MSPEMSHVVAYLERHWNEEGGYTAPNTQVYPWRWLWDSCFHALLWARLRPERALRELEGVFRPQDRASGFVPHIHYTGDPGYDRTLWGRDNASTITQPPMYGHAIRFLVDEGIAVPSHLVEAARRGLDFFFERRVNEGLVTALHPWETGCDDSPRWDSWVHRPFSRHAFALVKGRLVGVLELERGELAIDSDEFRVGSVALTALVAFNAIELAAVSGDDRLSTAARSIVEGLETRWAEEPGTWVDGGSDPRPSGSAPTLESLLPVLVTDQHWDRVRAQVRDRELFAARYGPRQVALSHPDYEPDGYWRGATWPQLNYLFWVAARRHGDAEWADELVGSTLAGAIESGWAEYWHPDTGEGLGASPQSWTGLAALMASVGSTEK